MKTNKRIIHRYAKKLPYGLLCETQGSFLHDDEKVLFESLPECRKHDFLSGRYLFKLTCKEIFNVEPSEISISYKNSKPCFSLNGDFYNCSISHCKNWVAISFSKYELVGIDIEEVKQRTEEFTSFIVSKKEALILANKVSKKAFATASWVIKEATLKSDPVQTSIDRYEITSLANKNVMVLNKDSQKMFNLSYFFDDGIVGAHII